LYLKRKGYFHHLMSQSIMNCDTGVGLCLVEFPQLTLEASHGAARTSRKLPKKRKKGKGEWQRAGFSDIFMTYESSGLQDRR
ncbi:MAG: hypothetical protein ACE5NN_05135, partial [Candidatus Bathyarchaeia archaeon]